MSLPKHLSQPPSVYRGDHPVISLLQGLPYSQILWENFEKLCVRLVREHSNIENCRQYGEAGDKQEGIDIYAKATESEKYSVYQCKREKKFGPKKIEEAVSTFLAGSWAKRSDAFIICTQESLKLKQRADKILEQSEILKKENIRLRVWDSTELDLILKKHPQIVYDFFGQHWCEAFCGAEFAKIVKIRKPLPAKRIYLPVPNYFERTLIKATDKSVSNFLQVGSPLNEIVHSEKRVALLGWANTGKSTVMRQLAYLLSLEGEDYYPYLIKLKNHTNESIEDYIPEINDLQNAQLLVLLDGLDEVPNGQFDSVKRKIQKFVDKYPNACIVVSCRKNFYITSQDTLQGFTAYQLQELTQHEVHGFLQKISSEKFNNEIFLEEVNRKRLNNLIYTPYYLIRLISQFREEGVLANNIAEITDRLITENIKKDVARYFPSKVAEMEIIIYQLLTKLAFVLEYSGKNNCSWKQMQRLMSNSELGILKNISSLLEGNESDDSLWSFSHNNIQECLAAKALQNQKIDIIRKIICFKPSFKRVKPSWSNTLSILISLVNEDTRKKLTKWLSKDHLDLIINFESDILSDQIRFDFFKEIFDHYTNSETRINSSKYGIEPLALFSKSEKTIEFLLANLNLLSSRYARVNSLVIITYYKIDLEFPAYSSKLKSAIEENLYSTASIPYLAIRGYCNCFRLSINEFDKLFKHYVNSNDTWALSALYEGINKQGYNEHYLSEILGIINDFMNSELGNDEHRLADEYMLLRESVENITSLDATLVLLDFIKLNYNKVSYSIYFREIIDYAFNIANTFGANDSIYQIIKDIYISENNHIDESRNGIFTNYFLKTEQLTKIFNDSYAETGALAHSNIRQLAQISNKESLDLIVSEFKEKRISTDNIIRFQNYLFNYNKGLLENFNYKISEIEQIPPPVNKDYLKEKQKKTEITIQLLFSKAEFIKAVDEFFIVAGSEQLSFDEFWELTRGDNDSKYPIVLYEAIRPRRNQLIKKEIVIERLEVMWGRFFIEELYRLMKNDSSISLNENQRLTIKTWCDQQLDSFKFNEAISQEDNRITTNWAAIHVSFFIRRLGFKHYPKETYLDMLSFQKWDDDAVDIFDFVKSIIDHHEIDIRILSNLGSGIKLFQVLSNHIEYCKQRKLKGAANLLIQYVENPNSSNRQEALDCFVFLNGDLSHLEKSLTKVNDDFRWHIIKLLIDNNSGIIKAHLQKQFRGTHDETEKLHCAFCLTKLQSLKGAWFYYKYIKRNKEVPMSPEAPYSNFLVDLRSLKFLPLIFRLHELGFDQQINQETFSNLRNIAAEALNSICLNNDNFKLSKFIFRAYKIWMRAKYIIIKNEVFKKLISDLEFYFENMEKQFYINKNSLITFEQALEVYKDFGKNK